jgi:uncharacterized protein YprB with RNaseH-like and TPR domain
VGTAAQRVKGSTLLQSTFCHIPGIGPKTERQLWSCGIRSWHAVDQIDPDMLPQSRVNQVRGSIRDSFAHLAQGNARYFSAQLATREHWRLFPEFRHTVAYLDIETTGLVGPGDYITTVALYDGRSVRHYVRGQNLEALKWDIQRYALLVTYNGKCFDVPFVRADLGIPVEHAHIDLRYILASLGFRGGLKACERQLGLDREDLSDVDGYMAVLLWHDYRRNGNERALETLLAYNILDVLNLEVLMVRAYNLKLRQTPFSESHRLSMPELPDNPFQADLKTVARLKHQYYW